MLITRPLFLPVSDLPPGLLPQLPELYYSAWSREGLCDSLHTAQKVLASDPDWSFALTDSPPGTVSGLLNTVPLSFTDPADIASTFPTYASVESSATSHPPLTPISMLLCFSLVAAPDTKVATPVGPTSVSRFLITSLRLKFPATQVVVYTRPKSVPMHLHLGASPTPVATLTDSRPEDQLCHGTNVILAYPLGVEPGVKIRL